MREHDWDSFLQNIADDHFEVQFPELDSSEERMILNDLEVYSTDADHVTVLNRLPEVPNGEEFDQLNQIRELRLMGINDREDYGSGIKSLYGYLELENGIILAATIMIRRYEGEYQIAGPVG